MREIAVVIPSHNGSQYLTALVPRLRSVLADLGEWEIVVVDDGSAPAEAASLRELVEGSVGVRLARLEERKGQIHATLLGVSIADGRIIVTMDDDGGHPPEVIPGMVELLRQDDELQLVYAAPLGSAAPGEASAQRRNQRPLVRHLGTALNNRLFHHFLGLPREVPVGSFRAIRRRLLYRALARPVRYPYLSAMLLGLDPKVACLHYAPPAKARHPGKSRYRFSRLLSVWVALLLYWGPLEPVGRLLRRPGRAVPDETYSEGSKP